MNKVRQKEELYGLIGLYGFFILGLLAINIFYSAWSKMPVAFVVLAIIAHIGVIGTATILFKEWDDPKFDVVRKFFFLFWLAAVGLVGGYRIAQNEFHMFQDDVDKAKQENTLNEDQNANTFCDNYAESVGNIRIYREKKEQARTTKANGGTWPPFFGEIYTICDNDSIVWNFDSAFVVNRGQREDTSTYEGPWVVYIDGVKVDSMPLLPNNGRFNLQHWGDDLPVPCGCGWCESNRCHSNTYIDSNFSRMISKYYHIGYTTDSI